MAQGYQALTEKEKQTLRLLLTGHDAKTMARHLGLSVHTINERLRDSRRKLSVSSSREAARALFDEESGTAVPGPDFMGDKQIGDADTTATVEPVAVPENGGGRSRRAWIIAGVALMSLVLALAAVTTLPQVAPAPTDSAPSALVTTAEVESAAWRFLTLVDQGKWDESYALTTGSFRKLNSSQMWAQASEQVRPPLGPVKSRTLLSRDWVPAPPESYQMVKFRTSFANKVDAVETVTLERAGDGWRVAAVIID